MLYDPHWNKPPEPSFEGFVRFVAMQVARNPDGQYYWRCTHGCAVGQYLQSLGCWHDWYKDTLRRGGLLAELDELASGGHWRDKRGRFARYDKAVWYWRDLNERLKEAALWLAVAA